MSAQTFRVPLPPVSKNKDMRIGRWGAPHKNGLLVAWARSLRPLLGDWTPPKRTPLKVTVVLEQPPGTLHRWGIDGRLGNLLDAVIGERADEWVDELYVRKTIGEGWAEITIEPLKAKKGAR